MAKRGRPKKIKKRQRKPPKDKCFLRKGTEILTEKGIFKVEDLHNKNFKVHNIEGKFVPAKCHIADGGNSRIVRIILTNGAVIECGRWHRFPVKRGIRSRKLFSTPAKDLVVGNYFPVSPITEIYSGDDGKANDGITDAQRLVHLIKTKDREYFTGTEYFIPDDFFKNKSERYRHGFIEGLTAPFTKGKLMSIVCSKFTYEIIRDTLAWYGIVVEPQKFKKMIKLDLYFRKIVHLYASRKDNKIRWSPYVQIKEIKHLNVSEDTYCITTTDKSVTFRINHCVTGDYTASVHPY